MNEHVTLYAWVREGASIHLAQVIRVDSRPASPGEETLTIELQIQQTLWGVPGESVRVAELVQSTSETTRLKFPDPIWWRVDLRNKPTVLLVAKERERLIQPLYVDQIRSSDDPVLTALNEVLAVERMKLPANERMTRYVRWVQEGRTVQTLFAAEALAKDSDLTDVDKTGQVAQAFAQAFSANPDTYVRLSVGTWMWEQIFKKTNTQGSVAILNATVRGLEGPDEDVRRFSLGQLLGVDTVKLRQPGILKNAAAAGYLQRAAQTTTVLGDRARMQHLLEVIGK